MDIEKSTENGNEKALKVGKQGMFRTDNKVCFFCKKSGQFKSDCRKFATCKKKNENPANAVVASEDALVCLMVERKIKFNAVEWCMDSGASAHMCNNEKYFTKIDSAKKSAVTLADGRNLPIKGTGIVRLKTAESNIQLEDVQFIPDLQCNLLSVGKLAKRGCDIIFKKENCEINLNGRALLTVKSRNDIYKAIPEQQGFNVSMTLSSNVKCIHEWHKVLGHRNLSDVSKMAELADDMHIIDCQHSDDCETCLQSKATRDPFPTESTKKTIKMLDLVHTDVQLPTPRGNRYILTLIDDFTIYSHIYLLKQKSGVASRFKQFIEMTRTQYGMVPKVIRSDRGGEYMDQELRNLFKINGIKTQLTVPKTPQQNGVAERKNRTLIKMTRCLLERSRLHKQYCGEAVSTANHILNRLPNKDLKSTPYELRHGHKPNLNYFHEFEHQRLYISLTTNAKSGIIQLKN